MGFDRGIIKHRNYLNIGVLIRICTPKYFIVAIYSFTV